MQWTPAARAELSINNSGTRQRCAAGGSEREGSEGTSDTWTGRDQHYERYPCAARLCCLALVPE
jgi:hypothetical protein